MFPCLLVCCCFPVFLFSVSFLWNMDDELQVPIFEQQVACNLLSQIQSATSDGRRADLEGSKKRALGHIKSL